MIRVKDLRVDYDNVCAVRDLSLEVGPGEVCGLIGPERGGQDDDDAGDARADRADLRRDRAWPASTCASGPATPASVVGFMPDFPPMYDDLKCWEFLDLFAASYGIPRAERPAAIERLLEPGRPDGEARRR